MSLERCCCVFATKKLGLNPLNAIATIAIANRVFIKRWIDTLAAPQPVLDSPVAFCCTWLVQPSNPPWLGCVRHRNDQGRGVQTDPLLGTGA